MKRYFSILLMMVILLVLVGCENDSLEVIDSTWSSYEIEYDKGTMGEDGLYLKVGDELNLKSKKYFEEDDEIKAEYVNSEWEVYHGKDHGHLTQSQSVSETTFVAESEGFCIVGFLPDETRDEIPVQVKLKVYIE